MTMIIITAITILTEAFKQIRKKNIKPVFPVTVNNVNISEMIRLQQHRFEFSDSKKCL